MARVLYVHPFSSYCWKVLIALYESDLPFDYRSVEDPAASAELAAHWPLKKFPLLVDDGAPIIESSIIVEHLDAALAPEARMIPAGPSALKVRWLDRFFDNYIMTPMTKIVADSMRAEPDRDLVGVADARRQLDAAYAWLDGTIGDDWAAGDRFTLADCAAAPALFYADWAHPVGGHARVAAYRGRLLARASVARAVEEARPYRGYFPLRAPDRD
jgi:glutathione S-transferase